jgi:hypothetical protein
MDSWGEGEGWQQIVGRECLSAESFARSLSLSIVEKTFFHCPD